MRATWASTSYAAPISAYDRRARVIWVETIVNGVLVGGLYGLLGVGLALIVGVMRVVNVSHGAFIVLAAFMGVSLSGLVPSIHPLVLLVPIVLVFFALGYVMQAALFNKIVARPDPFAAILRTFGLGVVMRNVMLEGYGAADAHGRNAGPCERPRPWPVDRRLAVADARSLNGALRRVAAGLDADDVRPNRARHRRQPRSGAADGRESRARLQCCHGARARPGERRRCAAGDPLQLHRVLGCGTAADRLRGRRARGARIVLGCDAWRHSARRRAARRPQVRSERRAALCASAVLRRRAAEAERPV